MLTIDWHAATPVHVEAGHLLEVAEVIREAGRVPGHFSHLSQAQRASSGAIRGWSNRALAGSKMAAIGFKPGAE